MTDGFIFYGSFMKALATLSDEDRLQAYDAICRYALFDEEPTCSGPALGMFYMAQAQIDANKKKRENGKKGGRPTTEAEPNDNQSKTKEKPNDNQTKTKPEPKEKVKDKDKDKDKVKEKVKDKEKASPIGDEKKKPIRPENPPIHFGEFGNVLLTDEEYLRLLNDYGEEKTKKAITYLDMYIPDKGYKVKSPTHYLAIRRWVMDAIEEQDAKKPKARTGIQRLEWLKEWAEEDEHEQARVF